MIVMGSWRGPFRDNLVFFPTPDEVRELADRCRSNEAFRIRHALDSVDVPSARPMTKEWTRSIDLRSERDALWRGMNTTGRYEVRRAERLGGRLELRRNDATCKTDFFRLLSQFVSWSRYTHPLSQRRYQQYLRVADVAVAYVDGSPVAGHLLLRDADAARVRLTFSASIRFLEGPLQRLVAPVNRWLHWQEFLLYAAEGYATYDFGGANLGSGIGAFKLSLGGELTMGWNVELAGGLVTPALRIFEDWRRLRQRREGRLRPVMAPPREG
jgi:hypothetical protein